MQSSVRCLTRIAVFIVAVTCGASAADPSDDRLEDVRLTLVNGSSIKVSIESIGADGRVTGQNLPDGFQFEQITEIDTRKKLTNPQKSGIAVHLVDGGIMYCDEVSTTSDRLFLDRKGSRLEFPLEVIRAIAWNENDQIKRSISRPPADNDLVVVETSRGQQIVEGILESIDPTHVRIKFEGESKKISRKIVKAVITADLKLSSPEGTSIIATMTDGSFIIGTINSFESGILRFNLSGGSVVGVGMGQLSRITVKSDRVAYLSDMEPAEVEQSSQFAAPRPWRRDVSVAGNPIQLRFTSTGKIAEFAKGLGTKPYSMLAFENANDFQQFRAIAGIDWETSGRGDCEMVVRGDGIQLWAKRIRGIDDPQSIVIDITGMKKISLIVLPGESFDLGDHADWANARFTKSN